MDEALGGIWEPLELTKYEKIDVMEEMNTIDFESQPSELRAPKTLWDPLLPTPLEVATHNVTHRPYRRWCPVCIEAWGREDPHRRGGEGTP